jgi:surface carbohydrate biosynthesis protein
MKYVYIVLETVARELNAHLLLAIGLLDSGFTPIILSQLALRDNLANLPKGIILDKGYGLSHIEAFKNYKKKGFKVAVLRSEPIVYNKRIFDIYHASGVSSLEWVDKFFSIGENYNNDVTHGGPVSLDSHITGNPRFNLFANEEFRFLFDRLKNSKSKIRSGKDYILIVGNFSEVNEIPDRNKEGVFPTLGLDYDSLYSNSSSLLKDFDSDDAMYVVMPMRL